MSRGINELSQSQEFYQQVLDSSDDCIKVLDLKGRILYMSAGGQALLGIQDVTPFLNMTWAEFWQGEDQQAAIEAITKANSGEICTFQGYLPTLRGEPKWWEVKVSPIRNAQGKIERLLCISRDISDRKRMEADLQDVIEELQVTEEELLDFLPVPKGRGFFHCPTLRARVELH